MTQLNLGYMLVCHRCKHDFIANESIETCCNICKSIAPKGKLPKAKYTRGMALESQLEFDNEVERGQTFQEVIARINRRAKAGMMETWWKEDEIEIEDVTLRYRTHFAIQRILMRNGYHVVHTKGSLISDYMTITWGDVADDDL